MKETRIFRYWFKTLVFLSIVISLASCKKQDYPLLDPSSAGVWTLYNTGTGLPGNSVQDVKLGSDGNLWVAFAESGAASLSNDVWTTFKTSNSGIISNYTTTLGPVTNGNMIIGTQNGLSSKTPSDTWSSFKDPAVTVMYIYTVKVTSNGSIWVGTWNQGFYLNTGTGFIHYYQPAYKNVYIIEEDYQGVVWLGTDNGVFRYDGTTFIQKTTADGLPDNLVTAIYPDSKKRLWIGTYGGETACWIDDSGIHQLSLATGTTAVYIADIFEDRKGDIWFATNGDGLIRYDGVVPYSFKEYNGFYENNVTSIGEDRDGNLWVGLYSRGLVKYTLPLE
jgi:ligand-binding sensor domain-containing protein